MPQLLWRELIALCLTSKFTFQEVVHANTVALVKALSLEGHNTRIESMSIVFINGYVKLPPEYLSV